MSPPRNKTACQTSPCKCKICISSFESDVYNKKKIQMFVVNMTFISSSEVKKCIFHSALMKYTFFHFTRWNKSHIHSKHLNILYIFLRIFMTISWTVFKLKSGHNCMMDQKTDRQTTEVKTIRQGGDIMTYQQCLHLLNLHDMRISIRIMNSNIAKYSGNSIIRVQIFQNYQIFRRRLLILTFFTIIYCKNITDFSNFNFFEKFNFFNRFADPNQRNSY